LTTASRRVLVNCCRQWGKSSITALVAVHECLYAAPARAVLVSPSQPQSTELFKKVHSFWEELPGAPDARQESLTRMELSNGAESFHCLEVRRLCAGIRPVSSSSTNARAAVMN
jgi:hypothetical protein